MSKNPKDYSKNPMEDDLLETNAFIHDFNYDVRGESLSRYPSAEQKREFRKQYDDKLKSESVEYIKAGSRKESADSFNPYIDRDLSKAYDSYETVQSLMSGNVEYGSKRSSDQITRSITNSEGNSDKMEILDVKRSVTERRSVINIDSRDRDRRRYPYSNDFEVKFRRSYINVKSVRLISSEFPNTEHAVREYPESQQNNVLSWQNKEDKYGFIYCMYPMYLDGNKLYVECFVNSVNYLDYRDKRTDVNIPIPTRLMIKNCKIRDNKGNEYLLNELNADGEYFDILYMSNLDTFLNSFQIMIDMSDYAVKMGNGWTASNYFTTTLYTLSLKYEELYGVTLTYYNQEYELWTISFRSFYIAGNEQKYEYYKDFLSNMDVEILATIYFSNMNELAISLYADIYDIEINNKNDNIDSNDFNRRTYTTNVYPGNYLSNTISNVLTESVSKTQTMNDDYNNIEFNLDIDTNLIYCKGLKELSLNQNFGLMITNRYMGDLPNFNDTYKIVKKGIHNFIIIRSYKHGLKNGDKIRLKNLYLSDKGIPLEYTVDKEYYVELLSLYKYKQYSEDNLDNRTYIKLFNNDEYEFPYINLTDFDPINFIEPIQDNYFMIRLNDMYSDKNYGIIPSMFSSDYLKPYKTEKNGVGTVQTELYKSRQIKFMFESSNSISTKIGFQNINSFERITRRIEEIIDYRYETYQSMQYIINYSIGIKIKVTNHNYQSDDEINITRSNSVPSIDGTWRIKVLDYDHILLLPNMNSDLIFFKDIYSKYCSVYPLFVSLLKNNIMDIELIVDNTNIGNVKVISIEHTSRMIRSKRPLSYKYGPPVIPLIKKEDILPMSIDFILDLNDSQLAIFESSSSITDAIIKTTEFWFYDQPDVSLDSFSLLNLLPSINDINDNMKHKYTEIYNASLLKTSVKYNGGNKYAIRILFEYYDDVDDIYINYIETTENTVLKKYYSGNTIMLYFSKSLEYEADPYINSNVPGISRYIWKRRDYYILNSIGSDGYINENPLTLINKTDNSMTLNIHYNNHSLSNNDTVFLSGFGNDERNMIDKYTGHYNVIEVVNKDNFIIKTNDVFPIKNLNNILITSKYHGFSSEQKNIDNYDNIQGYLSLDGDLYVYVVNDKINAIETYGKTKNVLAKINLTGTPGCVLYNSHISSPVVFYNEPMRLLDSFRLGLKRYDGSYFDNYNQDYSLTLEIIESVDKISNSNIQSRRLLQE